jgi:phosphatidylserine/phosphatidylglycerophosphate/cardiolipin synthase-like enzyme
VILRVIPTHRPFHSWSGIFRPGQDRVGIDATFTLLALCAAVMSASATFESSILPEPTEVEFVGVGFRVPKDATVDEWFFPPEDRGNADTLLDRRRDEASAYTEGNHVELLIHGQPYFARLHARLQELRAGDWVHFADWRGDPDEQLIDGEELAEVLADLAERGVKVRGLVWRSHPRVAGFHLEHHLELAKRVNDAGGLILLDQRVRPAGSHHQKLVLLRHAENPGRDIAFVGGIDLCHGRRDDPRHLGDPQVEELDEQYGSRPPWHDIQVAVQGPAIGDFDLTFRERWNDPTTLADRRTPWRAFVSRLAKQPERRDRLAEQAADPEPAGSHAIQVLRTYPVKRPPYPFASQGERSVVRAYRQAFARARCLIYVEDQYLWSREVARLFADALEGTPELRVMVIVPRVPDRNGPISGPPHRVAQLEIVARLREAGGDRFAIYDLENEDGVPIYVHAKTVVVDDVWAAVGSDNLNRRSWTHDSELSIAVLDAERDHRSPADPGGLGDGARTFARHLRTTLLAEHLGVDADALVDPVEAFDLARSAARALDRWHREGRGGPRPSGRVRVHHLRNVSWWQKAWAWPLYRTLVDPDGRSRRMKRDGFY